MLEKAARTPPPTTGKTAADEDYPFGSFLIAPHLRPHVMRFYHFARHADDIADDPRLSREEKHRRLDRLEAVLTGQRDPCADTAAAAALHETLAATGVDETHPRALLRAFRRDADNPRCADWQALMDYCALSAVPVGRFLLDLHGEGRHTHRPGDALCAAVQVLNHLQDCAEDRRELDRVYLPLDWLAAEGIGPEALDAPAAPPPLRRVLDRMLAAVEDLLRVARPLPGAIRDRRLRLEAAVILDLAERMARRLRDADPLAGRVRLPRRDALAGAVLGVLRGAPWR